MGAGKHIAAAVVVCVVVLAGSALAQQTTRSVRRYKVPVEDAVSARIAEAEAAIDRQDFAAAEKLLREIVVSDATDFRGWYYLGYVLNATERRPEAVDAYRRAVAAQPDVFEANLNLGLLLAGAGDPEAEKFLRAATGLKPSAQPEEGFARAWLSLGRLLQEKDPPAALEAFRKVTELTPRDAEPHRAIGLLLERQDDLAGAEQAFREAARLDPQSDEPLAGLIGVYIKARRFAEAEASLQEYLARHPQQRNARLQLARVLAAQGRSADALAEFEAAGAGPADAEVAREVAALYAAAENWEKAAQHYAALVAKDPKNAHLRHSYGFSLMKLRRFQPAVQQLAQAVDLKPDLSEAYGDLAIAASQIERYDVTIKALDARSRLLPETPATYFLRATAYDHLKAFKEAAVNYRQFLASANGRFPDQEWQARHRLKAIEPKKR